MGDDSVEAVVQAVRGLQLEDPRAVMMAAVARWELE